VDSAHAERHTKMATREEKKQREFVAALENLLKDPSNKKCADCGAAVPRWASASLGVFVCMRCAGIHRNIGVHITFVRSVTLDKWNEQQVQTMTDMGNARAESIYEAKIPVGYPRPNPNDSAAIEKWIRDKYERKRFMGDPSSPAQPKQQPALAAHQVPKPAPKPVVQQPVAIVRPNPTPVAAPAIGNLLGGAPATQAPAQAQAPALISLLGPTTSQQTPQQLPQQQQQMQQNPQQPLQGLTFPTAEEQNAAKKASLLSMFDQNQQQQQLQQQQQMQQAAMVAYQQQQAYLQQLAAAGGQPRVYYDPRTGQPMMMAAGYPYPGAGYGMPQVGMQVGVGPGAPTAAAPPPRQDQFATLFG